MLFKLEACKGYIVGYLEQAWGGAGLGALPYVHQLGFGRAMIVGLGTYM